MLIKNLRPYEVEIPDIGVVAAHGEVDVPDEIAKGTKPKGTKLAEDDPARGLKAGELDPASADYDSGTSGLLAQTDAWAAVDKKPATAGKEG